MWVGGQLARYWEWSFEKPECGLCEQRFFSKTFNADPFSKRGNGSCWRRVHRRGKGSKAVRMTVVVGMHVLLRQRLKRLTFVQGIILLNFTFTYANRIIMIFWKRNSPLNLLVVRCSENSYYYVAVAIASSRTDNNNNNINKITNPRLSPTTFWLLGRQRKTGLIYYFFRNTFVSRS